MRGVFAGKAERVDAHSMKQGINVLLVIEPDFSVTAAEYAGVEV